MRQRLIDSCNKWLTMDMLTYGYSIKVETASMSTWKLVLLRVVLPCAKGIRTIINL
jgi:hypothetical protein